MSETTLAIKGLKKKIGQKQIIKGIDFEIKKGEVFGFLGPNGSGKTTTIRMIVGLIKPTEGSIEICGHDVQRNFTEAMNHLGCIVENPELYPYLSGWENLQLFSSMMKNIGDDRLQEVVELVGLKERIHDKVKTYSLGMRQRLGIAQALLGKPSVLILDEPTNGLDPSGIREMRDFIRFLAEKEGLSVFVSSHLLSEIQLMCDRVAIISKGEVILVDSVEAFLNKQENLMWKVEPLAEGKRVFQGLSVDFEEKGEYLMTSFQEDAVGIWNRKLIEAGVTVHEMTKKIPSLEDVFLELTGGETID